MNRTGPMSLLREILISRASSRAAAAYRFGYSLYGFRYAG
jgi:hypothetical protein